MKLSKKFMKTLFTILILIFVLIPIINYFSKSFIKNTPYFEGLDVTAPARSGVIGNNVIEIDNASANSITADDVVTGVTPVIKITGVTNTNNSYNLTLETNITVSSNDELSIYKSDGSSFKVTASDTYTNINSIIVSSLSSSSPDVDDFIEYPTTETIKVDSKGTADSGSNGYTTITLDKDVVYNTSDNITFQSPTNTTTNQTTTDSPTNTTTNQTTTDSPTNPPTTDPPSPWPSSTDVFYSGPALASSAVEGFTDKPTEYDYYKDYLDSSINFITNINNETENQCSRYLTVSTGGTEGKLLQYDNSDYPYSTTFMNTTDCLNNNEISTALASGDIDVSLSATSTSWDLSFNVDGTKFTGSRANSTDDYLTVTDGTNTEKWYIKYDSYTPAKATYDLKMKDLITNASNYQFDACINRIDVSGVVLSPFSGTAGTGVSNEYIYCLGGTIKCGSADASLVTGDNWSGGNTYRATCNDGSTPTCNSTGDRANPLVIYGNKYDGTDISAEFNFMTNSKFTGPYNYVPIEETLNGYISVRPSESEAFFTQTPCLLYDTSSNCTDYLINLNDQTPEDREGVEDATNDTTDESTTTEEPDENSNRIKCVADNGAEIGDNVCCNQKGVIQNTIYNCPSEFPKCIGYKCGENWGYCASSGSEVGEYTEDETTTTAAPE